VARVMVSADDDPEIYYVVEYPVGPNAVNHRDDVLLVQFFLRILSDRNKSYRPPGHDLVISGAYNDLTGAYIKQYADANNQTPMYDNGNVVKRNLTTVDSPIGNTAVTGGWLILKMNLEYMAAFPKTGLPHSALFPRELRKKFYVG
jgi:hypothetical protein